MNIGIAVTTTPNRLNVYHEWYRHYSKFCAEIPLYVHNDWQYQGVAYSKNKCLNALQEMNCDYYFLFDDDCFITQHNWHELYINSGLEHACWNYNRTFLRVGLTIPTFYTCVVEQRLGEKPTVNLGYDTVYYSEYDKPNGCMLYATQKVIDTVGGFDTDFKGYGYDHVNWSDRIFNNGLTPARYIDIHNSKGLFEMANCESSFTSADRAQIPANFKLYQEKYLSKEFKPFK